MTQILDLLGGTRGTATRRDDSETTEALSRLKEMLKTTSVGTPTGEAPGGASGADNKTPAHPDTSLDAAANGGLASLLASPAVAAATDIDEPRASDDWSPDEDTCDGVDTRSAVDESTSQTLGPAEAALTNSVREAQERAEIQLMKLVDRIRGEAAEQHQAEIARLTHDAEQRQERAVAEAREAVAAEAARAREDAGLRHEEALQQIRNEVQVDVAAAVEAALKVKDGRHAEEMTRVQAKLDAEHVEMLWRVGDSVLASLETLTARMVQTAA